MDISCKFENFVLEKHEPRIYTCRGKVTGKAPGTGTNHRFFLEVHSQPKKNSDVRAVVFEKEPLKSFPRGFTEYFQTVSELRIVNCGLKTLVKEDLAGLEHLKLLYVTSNAIAELPEDLFENTTKLAKISFRYNELQRVSPALLRAIPQNQLKLVSFADNPGIDLFYWPSEEGSLDSIEALLTAIKDNYNRESDKIIDEEVDVKSDRDDMDIIDKVESEEESNDDDYSDEDENIEQIEHDLTITSNDFARFAAHRYLLIQQSQEFVELLKDNPMSIEIRESRFVVRQFVNFLYRGKIQGHAMELLGIAAQCRMEKLQKVCEEKLIKSLTFDNALKIFLAGHEHNSERLKQASFDKIKANGNERIPNELINHPEDLKMLVEAEIERVKKIESVEKEIKKRKRAVLEKYQVAKKRVQFCLEDNKETY